MNALLMSKLLFIGSVYYAVQSTDTIQGKDMEQYFPAVLFIVLYKMFDKILNGTNQVNAIEQYFPMVLLSF